MGFSGEIWVNFGVFLMSRCGGGIDLVRAIAEEKVSSNRKEAGRRENDRLLSLCAEFNSGMRQRRCNLPAPHRTIDRKGKY